MSAQTHPGAAPSAGASEKTLRVLSAALDHARFTDIVFETGLPKATVHRILATLMEQQFLDAEPGGGYRAGANLISLAGRALSSVDITHVAKDIVDDLVSAAKSTVHLGVAADTEIVYVMRRDPIKPYRMRSRVGLALPMHCSGMGKAVLATWSPDRVDDLVSRVGLPARTENTIVTREALHDELDRIRARGYSMDLGENEVGTVCVSAAIRDHTGEATHALSISSIALEHPGTSIEKFAPLAIAAGEHISRALAAPGY